jgi:hypothetical protein
MTTHERTNFKPTIPSLLNALVDDANDVTYSKTSTLSETLFSQADVSESTMTAVDRDGLSYPLYACTTLEWNRRPYPEPMMYPSCRSESLYLEESIQTTTNGAAATKKKTRMKRKKKDPKAPKHPMSPYLFYLASRRKELSHQNPGYGVGMISKLVAVEWKSLSEKDRAPFETQSDHDKLRYAHEITEWNNKNN